MPFNILSRKFLPLVFSFVKYMKFYNFHEINNPIFQRWDYYVLKIRFLIVATTTVLYRKLGSFLNQDEHSVRLQLHILELWLIAYLDTIPMVL